MEEKNKYQIISLVAIILLVFAIILAVKYVSGNDEVVEEVVVEDVYNVTVEVVEDNQTEVVKVYEGNLTNATDLNITV